jgi:hypothetical protein
MVYWNTNYHFEDLHAVWNWEDLKRGAGNSVGNRDRVGSIAGSSSPCVHRTHSQNG